MKCLIHKRKDAIIPYVLIAILCGVIFLIPFGNADELWNYNFAKGIVEGLIPYKEISMIPTPLSAYVAAFFLWLFGKGLFAYRIAGYVLMTFIFTLLYHLSNKILRDKTLVLVVILFGVAINYAFFIYSYNHLSVALILVIMLLEYIDDASGEKWWYHLWIGIIIGCLPIIKQNTGTVLFLINIAVCIYLMHLNRSKKKVFFIRIAVSMIPGILYLIFLFVTESFMDFWDYAIKGIGQFTHRIWLWEFASMSIAHFLITLIPIMILVIVLFFMFIKKDKTSIKVIYFIYAVTWLLVVTYPLFDFQHLFIGMIPLFPLYLLYIKDNEFLKKRTFECCLVVVMAIVLVSVSALPALKECRFSHIHNYEGIPMESSLEEKIETITAYIQEMQEKGIPVYIANEYACVYKIPLDSYEKNWDLLLVGNVGTATVEELLDVEDNSVFLVLKEEYELNRQAHFELINYIKENYHCTDEVHSFDVYTKVKK